jgi:predicted small lipoprotein YifL
MSLKSLGVTAGLLITAVWLAGCGKKGPLSLPATATLESTLTPTPEQQISMAPPASVPLYQSRT